MCRADRIALELARLVAILLALTLPAAAQDDGGTPSKRPTVSRSAPPSPNATINLINLLVKQGVLTEDQAAGLIKQADDEAYVARQAVRDATAKAEGADKKAASAADAVSPPGTKRVIYVPEIVKKQLREDIKKEVMAKAEQENWASPGRYPEWASRIRFSGDVRVRYEGDFFPKGNDPLSAVNYNSINTGNPYDVNAASNPFVWPTYNTDQDRNRARLRARLGMDADLSEGFWAGIRLATGDSSGPVSFNQTLGGSGGNFSKYSIWLDRAFIKYSPRDGVTFIAGRFDNPFFSPTDLVFYRDMGFDGFAARASYEVSPGITPFAVAGAFPIFNTDLNAGTASFDGTSTTFPSHDKWMFGAQIGADFHMVREVEFIFGAAYFDFTNVQGQLSSPCFNDFVQSGCDTDLTRPSFAQKGNTYMPVRNPLLDPLVFPPGTAQPNYQYFGLASAFRDAVLSGRLDLGYFHPVHIVLDGEYVRNIAWSKDDIAAKILNSPLPAGPTVGCSVPAGSTTFKCPNGQIYDGGNQGWLARMTVGYRDLKQFGDWNAFVGYKWLESDAVIDAFTDSDFGLGGTNLKGYFIGGNFAVGPKVWLTGRWLSANQIAGAPYAVDVLQVDLNAGF
jgi:Putative porin